MGHPKSAATVLAAVAVTASLAAAALAPDAAASESPLPTRVVTAEGPVQGAATGAVRTFQGIPYAAPPTGERRWKKPQPVRPWSATLDARAPRSACAQPTDQPIAIKGGGARTACT